MGADFLLYRLPLDHPVEEAHRRVDAFDSQALLELIANEIVQDFEIGAEYEDPTTVTEMEAAKLMPDLHRRLHEAVDFVYGVAWNREVAVIDIDGRMWAMTGGMSWGDAPTEIAGDFDLLGALSITYDSWELPAGPDTGLLDLNDHLAAWMREFHPALYYRDDLDSRLNEAVHAANRLLTTVAPPTTMMVPTTTEEGVTDE